MKYALKLARHGSVFLVRVAWIGVLLVVDFVNLTATSNRSRSNSMAGPEVCDGLDRLDPNYDLDWGWKEVDSDKN